MGTVEDGNAEMRVWVVVSCVYLYVFEAACCTYEGVLAIYLGTRLR
jgi:hypothetical protein